MYQIHIPARLYGEAALTAGFEAGPGCPGIVIVEVVAESFAPAAVAEPGMTNSRARMTRGPKIRAGWRLIAPVNTGIGQWVRRKVMTVLFQAVLNVRKT
jgi:hypothetical protein